MRSALRGIVIGVVLLALLGAIGARLGWITATPPRAAGPEAWLLARGTGLLAYLALALDTIVGLLVSTRRADHLAPRGALIDLHGWLAPLALGLTLAHASVLLADGYVRFDLLDIAVPFVAGHPRLALAAGVLAAYLALAVHLSFGLRKRLGAATWRRLHYLSFVAFLLVTLHALAAGTDRGHPWFVAVYASVLGAVLALVGVRLAGAAHSARRAASTPGSAS